MKYQSDIGPLPWRTLLIDGYDSAPWLSLLPAEANWSLHGWGRYLFSQTPACKRGSVSVDRYGRWLRDLGESAGRSSPTDTLVKCCAAFAHSPLSLVIDIRAALQCISLATKCVLAGERSKFVAPYTVEQEMGNVCAAGCGNEPTEHFLCRSEYGYSLQYCSEECAHTVSALPALACCWCYTFD